MVSNGTRLALSSFIPVLLVAVLAVCSPVHAVTCPPDSIIFVDESAGGANTGVSWTDAFTDLQAALTLSDSCPAVTEIHVAQGTYVPGAAGNRSATFQIRDQVSLYGGYPSGGGTRDADANVTILSGDISSPRDSDHTDNAYNIVTVGGGITAGTVVDGFTIRDGYADGSVLIGGAVYNAGAIGSGAATFNDMRFVNNYASSGGGAVISEFATFTNAVFDSNSSDAFGGAAQLINTTLTNAVFTNNTTGGNGGALRAVSSTVTNAVFFNNSAQNDGGGISLIFDNTLTNITLHNNDAFRGGGIHTASNGQGSLINGISWGNTDSQGYPEVFVDGTPFTVSYSLIEGSGGSGGGWSLGVATDGGNNIDVDPVFANGPAGDLHLSFASPAVDVGDSTAANLAATDIEGNPRIVGNTVDMGAYEFVFQCPADSILRVSKFAPGLNNGLTWFDAYNDLQTALEVAANCPNITQIHVAGGLQTTTYHPSQTGDRTATFQLVDGVQLLGGYKGDGSERNPDVYLTILSGDIGTFAVHTDNSYHVVTAGAGITASTIVDGFIIRDGYADGAGLDEDRGGAVLNIASVGVGNPTFNDIDFLNNYTVGVGGAVASETGTFTNVLFSGNTAVFIGGAAFVTDATFIDVVFANNNSLQQAGAVGAYGTCVFTNVVFEGNTGDDGGAVRNYGSAVFTNVTFTDNSALNGGALNNDTGSSPTIINTILWNNTASVTGPEIHNVGGATPSISYSLIEGSGGSGGGWDTALGTDGGNNIDADPLFVNAATADLRLMALSAARDAGDDAAPNLPASDLDGNPRTDGPAVDMGAYEYQVPCPPANVVFVDAMASGTHTGVSWVDAVSDLQLALITADECAMVTEVHVAEGTYVPGDPGDRAATFELREGVSFYGGYPNGGGTPDPAAHETILSGDISSPPDMVNTDNSYNVVTVGAGISAATVVDGFTIRDGYADGVSYPTNVAGAVNVTVAGSTPTFNTMRFLNNYSSGGTGAVFSQGGTMTNVVFDGNSTGNGSGAFTLWAGTLAMTDAVFTNNTAVLGGGGGFAAAGATSFTFTNVEFRDNTSTTANGGAFIALSSGSFVNALFQDNSCPLNGGAILVDDGGSGPPHVDFTNVTFTENDGTLQGGAIAYGSATSSIINGIFWNNTSNGLPEIAPAVPGNISIRHSLIQGSNGSGGSWNGVLGVDLGGNIDADPVFVDAATGDLHLAPTSPAINAGDNAAANLPVTDLDASPRISGAHVDMGPYEFGLAMEITSISDVGNDQGGFVRVQWNRASLDVIGSAESILEYSVWRLANPAPKPETSSKAEANPEHMTGPLPPGTWDMLTTIPATTDLTYSTVVTTTCDSTVGAGQCFSTFLIRAHTQFPSVVYESAPDSGYSVDNLAPGPPMMALAGSLSSWSHSSAPDFAYYTIYSVPEQHTLLDPDYMVATTTDTTVVLPDSTTGEYIVVTATDTSGNESEESNRELHQTPTSVGNVSPPSKTALHQNAPNPFNPSTRISFDVASATRVTLRIFDVSGRHVRTLVDRDMIPNRYDIVWNGTNDHGSRVASGVYVYRLEAGEFAEQRKMLMLK